MDLGIVINYKNWLQVLLSKIEMAGFLSMLGVLLALLVSVMALPPRELLIEFKDGDTIRIPYYKHKHGETILEFVEEVKEHDAGIQIINKRKITDLKIIIIFFLLFFLLFRLQLYSAYNSKFEKAEASLDKEIKSGNYYTDEEFAKLKFLKTDKISGYNIYENVATKKKIRIKENKTLKPQQEYNFLHTKYFSKSDKEKLIGEKYYYLGAEELNNEIHLKGDGMEYYIFNGKLYKFYTNVLGRRTYYGIKLYDNEEIEKENWEFLNRHKVYNFIYSDKDFIYDQNNNFKSFEKKEILNSEYGKCYIIKADEYRGTSRRRRCVYLCYVYRN